MTRFSSVLISGASSGIGAALALACAGPGVTLHLGGRDGGRLGAVAAQARARGAEVMERIVDVRDAADMAAWVRGARRLDLVVANAGISAGTGTVGAETPEQVRSIFATNLDGALNLALPALEVMGAQAPGSDGVRGRIATVASIAAFVPAPGAPSYCASKAALDGWTVATAEVARRRGIVMTSVCPGYIRTPMTATNRFPMPGLMDADRAAAIILRGIGAGKRRVAFPWYMAAVARLMGVLPVTLVTGLVGRAEAKAGE